MKKVVYTISKKTMAHDGFLPIEKGEIHAEVSDGKTFTYTRERVLRNDAVAVLLFNRDTQRVLLTKQFRFAIYDKNEHHLLTEIPAGKMDAGEEPADTAIREIMEECGVEIKKSDLILLSSFFASPGYTAEKYHLFFASFSNAQRVAEGGGLEEEHEFIQVEEVPVNDFFEQVINNQLPDAKTIIAALLARQKGLL